MKHLIAPSILAADFANLQRDIEMVNESTADWFHVDIMDGVFVPNISFGFPVIKAIKKYATKPLDVHLMIANPDRYIFQFKDAGADVLTVHHEACDHLHRTIYTIKSLEMKAGVALNPHTPVSLLKDIIRDVDLVCLMSVNPGYGGQQFIPHTINKVMELKALIEQMKSKAVIEIDGGVNFDNAKALVTAGANVLVAGSTVFRSPNPIEAVEKLKKINQGLHAV
ncbi:MAG: ribulose-phosphate 3-epimerase [Chitinophagales bacterium]